MGFVAQSPEATATELTRKTANLVPSMATVESHEKKTSTRAPAGMAVYDGVTSATTVPLALRIETNGRFDVSIERVILLVGVARLSVRYQTVLAVPAVETTKDELMVPRSPETVVPSEKAPTPVRFKLAPASAGATRGSPKELFGQEGVPHAPGVTVGTFSGTCTTRPELLRMNIPWESQKFFCNATY
jgi:hypothetical protein